jgi:hypothetical protein
MVGLKKVVRMPPNGLEAAAFAAAAFADSIIGIPFKIKSYFVKAHMVKDSS